MKDNIPKVYVYVALGVQTKMFASKSKVLVLELLLKSIRRSDLDQFLTLLLEMLLPNDCA